MPDIGSLARAVNSRKFTVTLEADELIYLQNARLIIEHTEDPEDTTSGGVVYFSGNPRYVLEGTVLYTTDIKSNFFSKATSYTNGEVNTSNFTIKLTGRTTGTDTYTVTGKIESFVPNMDVPGGSTFDIRIIILTVT